MTTTSLLERVIRLVAAYDAMSHLTFTILDDDGYWAGEGNQNGQLSIGVNCNDLFWWATADLEPIETAEDVASLEECLAIDDVYGPTIYACRRRKMRPQNCVLRDMPAEIVPHLESCGPARALADDVYDLSPSDLLTERDCAALLGAGANRPDPGLQH